MDIEDIILIIAVVTFIVSLAYDYYDGYKNPSQKKIDERTPLEKSLSKKMGIIFIISMPPIVMALLLKPKSDNIWMIAVSLEMIGFMAIILYSAKLIYYSKKREYEKFPGKPYNLKLKILKFILILLAILAIGFTLYMAFDMGDISIEHIGSVYGNQRSHQLTDEQLNQLRILN